MDVPAGPGGLKPAVSLSYASNANDGPGGTSDKLQASWVGRGWSLDPAGAIALSKNTCCSTWDHFSLTAMGKSFTIVRGNALSGAANDATTNTANFALWNWHIADESYWKVKANSNNTWTVWSPDGLRYEFTTPLRWGWKGESGQPDWYETYKWLLTAVIDPSGGFDAGNNPVGNRISFEYVVDTLTPYGSPIDPTYRLSKILWGYDGVTPGTGTPRYQLEFIAAARQSGSTAGVDVQWDFAANQVYTNPFDPNAPDAGAGAPNEKYRLDEVRFSARPPTSGAYENVTRWQLAYAATASSVKSDGVNGQRMLTLMSVTQSGWNPSTNQWNALPATSFTYGMSRGSTSPTPPTPGWNRLLTATNGYAGKVSYTYGHIWSPTGYGGAALPSGEGYYEGSAYAYRFRVLEKKLEDTAGKSYSDSVLTTYSYAEPALNTSSYSAMVQYALHPPPFGGDSTLYLATPEKSEFRGHDTVITQIYDGPTTASPLLQRTQEWFYQGKQLPSGCLAPLIPGATSAEDYVDTNSTCFQDTLKNEAWRGRAYKSEVQDTAGTALQRTETSYRYVELPFYLSSQVGGYRRAGLWRAFTGQAQVIQTQLDGANISSTRTETFYAANCGTGAPTAYGQPICVKEYNHQNSLARTTTHSYAVKDTTTTSTPTYIVDRPSATSIQDSAGVYLAHSQRFYDGNNTTLGALGIKGQLTRDIQVFNIGGLSSITNVTLNGSDRTTTYDGRGMPITETGYDGAGWVKWTGSAWQASSPGNGSTARTTTTAYDGTYRHLPVSITNPLSHVTRAAYDFRLSVLIEIDGPNGPSGGDDSFDCRSNLSGNTATVVTGDVTCAGYDVFGRMVKLVKPGDQANLPTLLAIYYDTEQPYRYRIDERETAGASGVRISQQFYDGLGQPVQTKLEVSSVSPHRTITSDTRYDGLGRVIQQSQPRYLSETSTSFYAYTAPSGSIGWTTTTYDIQGRTATVTDPANAVTTHRYGVESGTGRTWHDVTDANRHRTQWQHDSQGRLVKVIELSGDCATYWGYTCAAPYTSTWAIYATTTYGYDALDRLISVEDAKGNDTTISYDSLGRKTGMVDPDMGSWSYAYDADGNLIRQTDARGKRICFYYDALNRLTGKHYRTDNSCPAAPSLALSYGYDAGSNGIGQRTSMSVTGGASTSWTYDSRGRLDTATHTGPSFTGSRIFNWDYDSADRLTSMIYPAGGSAAAETITYSYDGAWRQTQVCISGGSCYAGSARYRATGQIDDLTLGNTGTAQLQNWMYDAVGRVVRLQLGSDATVDEETDSLSAAAASVFDRQYAFDTVGNITSLTDKKGVQALQSYAYDHRDRLVSWTLGGTPQSYGYDTLGNLTTKAGVVQQYGANYDGTGAGPHQLRRLTGAGGPTFSYDANGNMTSGGGRSYVWNDESMPTSITVGGVPETYAYNADGARVSVSRSGTTTTYLEGQWEEASGGAVRKYYTLAGQTVAVRTITSSTNTISYLQADHLGSVSLSLTSAGAVDDQQEFDPWGAIRSGGVAQTTRTFTGQHLDQTGLLFYNARYYDPAIGRFVSADTIVPGADPLTAWPSDAVAGGAWRTAGSGPTNPQELSRYTYALNNPVRYNDPTGHCVEVVSCTIAGGTAGTFVCGPVCGAAAAAGAAIVSAAVIYGGYVLATSTPGDDTSGNTGELTGAIQPEAGVEPLKPGDVGSYGDLTERGFKGDDLEAHHIPQAALGHTGHDEGGAIALPKGEHRQTRTYGSRGRQTAKDDAGESFRDVVAKDIRDLRRIAGSKYNTSAKKLLDYYRQKFPNKMKKE